MSIKNAVIFLAADFRKAALGAGGFVAVGSFFGGSHWNLLAGMLVFGVLEGFAFYLQVLSERLP